MFVYVVSYIAYKQKCEVYDRCSHASSLYSMTSIKYQVFSRFIHQTNDAVTYTAVIGTHVSLAVLIGNALNI